MSFSQWVSQLDFTYVLQLSLSALASILCITVHESAHGLVALWMGDPTAKRMGRISLNPFKHVDLVGLVMLAVAHVGWAKPVPVNSRYFKKPKQGMVLTALAGPISNFLLAFITGFAFVLFYILSEVKGGDGILYYLWLFFLLCTQITCGLGVFNLIPIPPLDGSKVLYAILPEKAYFKLLRFERYGMLLLIALVAFGAFQGFLSQAVEAVSSFVIQAVSPLAILLVQIFL